MSQKRISIIGCGWLGLPLASHLIKTGYEVKGSTTTTEKLPALTRAGIEAHLLQLNPEPVGNLADLMNVDTLIVNIPPKAGKMGDAFHPAQIQHIAEAIQQSPVRRIIYVSSTSVYPELNRPVVESDVIGPTQSAAPSLVEAEQLIQRLEPERQVCVLRCGGLLGYDRIPGKYVAGRTVDSGAVPVNYLHRDDAVGILTALIEHNLTGTVNAVAPEHPLREAIYRKSCADFGYELPTFVVPPSPVPYKVIDTRKLSDTINYQFRYPDPLHFFYERSN